MAGKQIGRQASGRARLGPNSLVLKEISSSGGC